MKFTSFTHIGTRQNNEDSLGHSKHAFIVCDGMGGHTSGEVASKFVVEEVLKSVENLIEFSKESIAEILEEVQVNLNKKLETQPELLKMGTTFTGVFFAKDKVFVAHIGDSRVYLVRPSTQKIWHTWDHSLVGGLMQSGEITREKGRLHPMSNRISKAITANDKGKTVKPDIVQINSLQKGDLFLLCSDGVNEGWKEHELMHLLCDLELSSREKLNKIEKQCAVESRDNNTAILIEIEGSDVVNHKDDELSWLTLEDFDADYNTQVANEEREAAEEMVEVVPEENDVESNRKLQSGISTRKFIYFILIAVVVIALLLLFS